MAGRDDNRPLKEYAAPNARGLRSGIARPAIEAQHFTIPPALLSMIRQNQFGGLPSEDPNDHVDMFLEFCETLRIEGASVDAIRLRLFPSSLRDRARAWLRSVPAETITTWDQLEQAFLDKFFPPSKTAHLRTQITSFIQKDGESLSEAWDRYKALLEACPHHGLEKWLIVHTFYNGLEYSSKVSLDSAAGGALMNRGLADAYSIIESVAANHHQWANERGNNPRKLSGGKYEVDGVDLIMSKFDSLNKRFDKLEKANVNAVGATNLFCEICGAQGHVSAECQVGMGSSQGAQVEQVESCHNFHDFNQKGRNDPYSQTYNPGWRSHPNFSYRNTQNQAGQGSAKPSSGFQQVQNSKLESLLESFVESQSKQNEEFRQHGKVVTEAIRELSAKVDNLAIHNKMLETQIAQQASMFNRQPGKFPGQPEINPGNEQCNAVILRSGKTLKDGKGKGESDQDEGSEKKETKIQPLEVDDTDENVSKYVPPEPYQPPVPFPQRLAKAKLDKQFGKFLEVLKKLYINVPFTEALQQMPTYAKFLKDILSNKRKVEEYETIALTEECSALFQNKLPPKLKDPGSFSIPCLIGDVSIDNALCDLGAGVSLMPLSIFERMGIGELRPTGVSLQFADSSMKKPLGIVENIPIKVGKFFIPVDFMVLDMQGNSKSPIILGRPFLATAGAIIDVKKGKLSLNVGEERVDFDLTNPIEHSSLENSLCRIDSLPPKEEGESRVDNPPKLCLANDTSEEDEDKEGTHKKLKHSPHEAKSKKAKQKWVKRWRHKPRLGEGHAPSLPSHVDPG